MIYGTYLSATGIAQAQAKQDVIANNLANAETTGFRRLLTLEQQRPPEPDSPDYLKNSTGGNVLLPTQVDTSPGGLEQTNRPLDVAVVGDGYLSVSKQTPAGPKVFLTRDGRMSTNADGQLTLTSDPTALVLGRDGLPITLPPDVSESDIVLEQGGAVVDKGGRRLGDVRIANVNDPSRLVALGSGLLDPRGPVADATGASLRSGYIETSNVDPTLELTHMIRVSRRLEANANLIRQQDSTLGRLIEASALT